MKLKGMSRNVSDEEVIACLHSGGLHPSDYFLLTSSAGEEICYLSESNVVMSPIIEDDDVAKACAHYMRVHGFPLFTNEAEAVSAMLLKRRTIS